MNLIIIFLSLSSLKSQSLWKVLYTLGNRLCIHYLEINVQTYMKMATYWDLSSSGVRNYQFLRLAGEGDSFSTFPFVLVLLLENIFLDLWLNRIWSTLKEAKGLSSYESLSSLTPTYTYSVMRWDRLVWAGYCQLLMSIPNSRFSDSRLIVGNWPWWVYFRPQKSTNASSQTFVLPWFY